MMGPFRPRIIYVACAFAFAITTAGCTSFDGGVSPEHEIIAVSTPAGDNDLYVLGHIRCDPNRPKTDPGGLYWDYVLKPGDVIETTEGQVFTWQQVQDAIEASPKGHSLMLTKDGQVVRGRIR